MPFPPKLTVVGLPEDPEPTPLDELVGLAIYHQEMSVQCERAAQLWRQQRNDIEKYNSLLLDGAQHARWAHIIHSAIIAIYNPKFTPAS